MWSLISIYANYFKIGAAVLVACICFYGGFHIGNNRYLEYKQEQETLAKAQEAHVESIQKQHELVTKGIQDEYNAKLALLRQYYVNGVRQPSTSTVPGISTASSIADATTAYTILVGQCAETTLQLVELQKWMLEQVAIK